MKISLVAEQLCRALQHLLQIDFMRWLQLRFDVGSMAVLRAFDCLSKVIKVTVT